MGHVAIAVVLSDGDEEDRCRAAAEVVDVYSRVREYSPEELEGDDAPTYAEVLTALRLKSRGLEAALPSRRVLAHLLAGLDYYLFALPDLGYVYDMPRLTDEERAAEHGLRHDLLLKLYDELEPAFDVSLSWPQQGYEVDENGVLIKDDVNRMEAIGFDCGCDPPRLTTGGAWRSSLSGSRSVCCSGARPSPASPRDAGRSRCRRRSRAGDGAVGRASAHRARYRWTVGPRKLAGPSEVQRTRIASTYSSSRAPRLWKGIPRASNSWGSHPAGDALVNTSRVRGTE
ncbi:MAG TPA: hypothetical protein VFJ72_05585 [Rubrobacteraceae bacterium]|nr:hypothetical protein [Rubrobacteraceae bacterium]